MHIPAISMENPLLIKELRSRMRGAKAYWVLLVYLLILSISLVIAYAIWSSQHGYAGRAFVMGRIFFQTLFGVQVGLVCLIAPGLTAGTVTVEKEQQTYDLLAASPLAARSIIIGKLLSALSFIVLLITSSLPLVSVCFLLGGVSPGEVFFAYLVLLLTAFMYGSVGIMWSSVARNTATATLMTYGTVFAIFIGTMFFVAPFTGVPGPCLKAVNPVGAFMYVVSPEQYFGFTMPAWVPSLILNGLAGILFTMIGVRKVDSYAVDKSVGLRVQSLLLYTAVVFFAFGSFFTMFGNRVGLTFEELVYFPWAIVLTILLVVIPIFATGDVDAREPRRLPDFLIGGWRKLFRSTLESGIPFIVLLLFMAAIVFLAGYPMTKMTVPGQLGWELPIILLVILAVVTAYGLISLLLSHILKSRWAALMSSYLVMAIFVLLPLLTLTNWDGGNGEPVPYNPGWLTLYFNPHIAVSSVPYVLLTSMPDPSAGKIPFSYVTILLYALIALLAAVKLRSILAPPHPQNDQ